MQHRLLYQKMDRVIAVADADSFEVQVYQQLPQWAFTKGHPCVVYDEISGRIVSVSPEAKAMSIPRGINVGKARAMCPGLLTIPKAPRYKKQENKLLRIASYKIRKEIIAFIDDFKANEQLYWGAKLAIEQNGCDEYFLDLTALLPLLLRETLLDIQTRQHKVIIEGDHRRYTGRSLEERMYYYDEKAHRRSTEEYKLAVTAEFMDDMIQHVKETTGYVLSVGIGSNKVIAKIACKVGKPKGVTAMTDKSLWRISEDYDFRNVHGFGGRLGLKILRRKTWGQMSLADLRRRAQNWPNLVRTFGERDAHIIRLLANGISTAPVQNKFMNTAVNCSKGNLKFNDEESEFRDRLNLLAQELMERIREEEEYNKRRPVRLVFQYFFKTYPRGAERRRKFTLSFPISNVGEAQYLSVGSIVGAAADRAIRGNSEFRAHLPWIFKMSVGVPEFRAFETFYEDSFYNTHIAVTRFMIGKSNLKHVNGNWVFLNSESQDEEDDGERHGFYF